MEERKGQKNLITASKIHVANKQNSPLVVKMDHILKEMVVRLKGAGPGVILK